MSYQSCTGLHAATSNDMGMKLPVTAVCHMGSRWCDEEYMHVDRSIMMAIDVWRS